MRRFEVLPCINNVTFCVLRNKLPLTNPDAIQVTMVLLNSNWPGIVRFDFNSATPCVTIPRSAILESVDTVPLIVH